MKMWSVFGMLFFGLLFTSRAYAVSCIHTSDSASGTIVVLQCGPPATWATFTGCNPNNTPPAEEGCEYPTACQNWDGEADVPESCGDPVSVIRVKTLISEPIP